MNLGPNKATNLANRSQPKLGSARRSLFAPRVKPRELANITSQLAIMTKSGVDIASGLESLARQSRIPYLKQALQQVHESVLGGARVSESLSHFPDVFNQTYVSSVAAGEASGRLPEVLTQLAGLLRGQMKLRQSVRTMLAYPILLTSVSGVVIVALVLFVLPKFAEIFNDFDAPLPVITQLLLSFSHLLLHHVWLWLPLAVATTIGLILFARGPIGRRAWDHFTLNCVVIRDVTRTLLIGRTCRLLGLMIESGVPLLESLRLSRLAVKNSLYQDLFVQLEDDVLNGRNLSGALFECEFVPGAASEMMMTAEKTGTLGSVAQMIGQHYEEEGESKLKELVAIMEPVVTVGMGIVIAFIVSSVMLPLFDLSSAAK